VASQVEQIVRVTEATLEVRDMRESSSGDMTAITDLDHLFSHEIETLTNSGGFPEAGVGDGDFWGTVLGQPQRGGDLQWDALFASFEDIFP
jgi:hypothetical protein